MRKVAAAGCAVTLVAVLAACGGSDSDGSTGDAGSSEVTVWMYPVIADEAASKAYWEGLEADFEAANDGVDLTIELQPWEGRQEQVTTALASGTGPDIILLGPDQIPQYVEQGTLAPVDDIVEGSEAELLPNALEALSTDGSVYGVPIYQTVITTTYNKALFDAAGITEVPTTWDDVLAAAPSLAANGVATLDYPGGPEESLNLTFYPYLWQAGGQVFSDDGSSVAFDSPEGVEALQFLLDLQAAGGLMPDVATATSTFEGRGMPTQKAAMTSFTDLAMAVKIAEAVGEENLVVGAPLEGPDGQATFGIPGSLTLADKAKDNEGAAAFLSYMLEPDVLAGLAAESGFFPPSEDIDVPGAHEFAATFKDALPFTDPGPTHPQARQVMAILSSQIQAALLGQVSAEDALKAAADEANALLGSAG